MNKDEIVFSTATWARTKQEKRIIEVTLLALGEYGFPIVIVDKKNSKFPINKAKFRSPLYRIYESSGSFFEQKKKLFFEASKIGNYVFWLESDKLDFVKRNIKEVLKNFKKRDDADFVLVPFQNKKSFFKYPRFQQIIEKGINSIFSEILGLDGIFTYGPIIFPSYFVKALKRIRGKEFGWGIIVFLLFFAFTKDIPIIMLPLGVKPPSDVQKDGDLKIFRLEQFKSYILAFQESIKIFKPKK